MERAVIAAVLAVVLFAPPSSAQPNAAAPDRIIDMHVHAFASDPRWQARIGNPDSWRT